MSNGSGAQATSPSRARAAHAVLLALLLLAGGALLHVPRERVPLLYDMLGYASQAHSLLTGHGNTVAVGDEHLPGIYPAGVPALAAAAMVVLGPDLRNGLWAILLCAVATLLCVYLCTRAAGGSAWAACAALLLMLCSPLWRNTSGFIMSQVPTAMAVALATLLWLSLESPTALLLAGLLAMLSLLLRYANVSFPLALIAAELLLGGARPRPRLRSLALLAAGMAAGAALVLLHNAVCYGDALTTGYALWGWDVEGQFGWRNILAAPSTGQVGGDHVLLSAAAGLGQLQNPVVVVAAVAGLLLCWRDGSARPRARLLAGLAVLAVGATYLFHAGYAFRSESYLVPTLPFTVVLAACGAGRLAGPRWQRSLPVLAAILLAISVAQAAGPTAAETESIQRFATMAEATAQLPDEAVLITTADPGLVEPVFRSKPGRSALYLGPYASGLIEERALRELGSETLRPRDVVAYARERLHAGRDVYLDQSPPPRGLLATHVAIRTALRAAFVLSPVPGVSNVFRLARADGPRPTPPSGK